MDLPEVEMNLNADRGGTERFVGRVPSVITPFACHLSIGRVERTERVNGRASHKEIVFKPADGEDNMM